MTGVGSKNGGPGPGGSGRARFELRLVGDTPTYQLGVYGPVLLQRIRATPPVAYVTACNVAETEVYTAAPDRYCSIVVIESEAALPDAQFRAAAMDLWRKYGDRMQAQSIVLAGGGFWASAIRAALMGILAVGGRRVRRKVTASVADGVSFLAATAHLSPSETVALPRSVEPTRTRRQ